MIEFVYTINFIYGECVNEYTDLHSIYSNEKKAIEECEQIIKNNSMWIRRMVIPIDIYLEHIDSFECKYDSNGFIYDRVWCNKEGYSAIKWKEAHEEYIRHPQYKIEVVKYALQDVVEDEEIRYGTRKVVYEYSFTPPKKQNCQTHLY
jgi:hypothetical protein